MVRLKLTKVSLFGKEKKKAAKELHCQEGKNGKAHFRKYIYIVNLERNIEYLNRKSKFNHKTKNIQMPEMGKNFAGHSSKTFIMGIEKNDGGRLGGSVC